MVCKEVLTAALEKYIVNYVGCLDDRITRQEQVALVLAFTDENKDTYPAMIERYPNAKKS